MKRKGIIVQIPRSAGHCEVVQGVRLAVPRVALDNAGTEGGAVGRLVGTILAVPDPVAPLPVTEAPVPGGAGQKPELTGSVARSPPTLLKIRKEKLNIDKDK